MNRRIVPLGVVAVLLLVACLAAACGSDQSSQPSAGSGAPSLSGEQLLDARCGSCHAVTRATQSRKTLAEWESTVQRMRKSGANLTDAEAQVLSQYLANKYSK